MLLAQAELEVAERLPTAAAAVQRARGALGVVGRRNKVDTTESEVTAQVGLQKNGLSFALEAPGCRHTRWLSVIRLDPARAGAPEALRLALEAANIESRPIWKPMHLQPAFAGAAVIGGAVAESLFATGLCLPSGSALTDDDIDRVCDVITAVMN